MKRAVVVNLAAACGGLLMLGFGGCAIQPVNESWVKPRPLGKELSAYRAPREETNTPARAGSVEEPSGGLTMRQALALALTRNPELVAFSWDVRIGEARQLQAGLYPNPELGVGVENVLGTGDYRAFREAQTTLQLSQLVLLGGKRAKAIEEARLSRKLAAWDYETARLDVFSRTASDFIEVLAAQQQLALTKELVRLAEQVVQAVQERVKAAKSSTVELTRAKVALNLARIDGEQAQRAVAMARQRLSANWGNPQPKFETVAGNLRDLPSVPSLQELTRRLEQNPELARWAPSWSNVARH